MTNRPGGENVVPLITQSGDSKASTRSRRATTSRQEGPAPVNPEDQGRHARKINTFFSSIDGQRVPLLDDVSGTLRFDLSGGRAGHWYVAISKGQVTISENESPADAIVHVSATLFEEIVSGNKNTMAAVIRGAVVPEGDLGLFVRFQRLFPGPPREQLPPDEMTGAHAP